MLYVVDILSIKDNSELRDVVENMSLVQIRLSSFMIFMDIYNFLDTQVLHL